MIFGIEGLPGWLKSSCLSFHPSNHGSDIFQLVYANEKARVRCHALLLGKRD
jgi:hypothetical protein